jgi:hypothetical protein
MTLFDRQLFFATFDPAAGTCETGSSTVYGVNYIRPELDGAANIDQGGYPELPDGSGGFLQNLPPVDGVAFGVGIRQLPSCSDDTASFDGDPYLGYGSSTTTSFSRPGAFELVIQRGGVSSSSTGGGQSVVTQTIALDNPRVPVQVSTWAPILE